MVRAGNADHPDVPKGEKDCPPGEFLRRIHFMHPLLTLIGLPVGTIPHSMHPFRDFSEQGRKDDLTPDERATQGFLHVVETRSLPERTLKTIDGTRISTPSSTKNPIDERIREIMQSYKDRHWFFGLRSRVGLEFDWSQVHAQRANGDTSNNLV